MSRGRKKKKNLGNGGELNPEIKRQIESDLKEALFHQTEKGESSKVNDESEISLKAKLDASVPEPNAKTSHLNLSSLSSSINAGVTQEIRDSNLGVSSSDLITGRIKL